MLIIGFVSNHRCLIYTEVIWERGFHTLLESNIHKQPEINSDMLNVFSLFQVHAIARFMGSRIFN